MAIPPEIFDRRLRRLRRDRAARDFADHAFLIDHMVEEILDRLTMVTRQFERALVIGAHDGRIGAALAERGIASIACDAGFAFAAASGGVQADEDRLPFADGAFDLVISTGVLDMVNDLPGALMLIRRVLRPDGLFLGAFLGAGTLPHLRAATIAADSALGDAVPPRIHPQVDVRAAGDLLARAGFAMPVADGEQLSVGYSDVLRLANDLRGMGFGNQLVGQSGPRFGKARTAALIDAFARHADPDGRVRETFAIVHLSGWAPGPDQPKPAKRGSATASLIEVLGKPRQE